MKALDGLRKENLLFYDIETVRIENKLTEESQYYEAWKYKTRYNSETNKFGDLTSEQMFNDKAALYAPFAKIVSISVGKIIDRGDKEEAIALVSFHDTDEKELLTKFNNQIEKWYDKNNNIRFVGYNNKQFDGPMIFKRMLVNGIKPHLFLDKSGLKPWEDNVIDLAELWKGNAFYQDSLVSLTSAFGLSSSKCDIDGSETSNVYWEDETQNIVRIAQYCERDVAATINLYRKFVFQEPIEIILSSIGTEF